MRKMVNGELVEMTAEEVAEWQAQHAIPVAELRQTALTNLKSRIDTKVSSITGDPPAHEVASWATKASAARAYVGGTARPDQTTMIELEASLVGRTGAEVAATIIAKADAYASASVAMYAIHKSAAAGIATAQSGADLDTILTSVQTQLDALV